jgi:hypothetical protein
METTVPRPSSGQAWSSAHPCGSDGRPGFPFGVLERPRYFPRQLITPDEPTLEAAYFRDRLRRHNIYLHGWGVVCGALVCVVPAGQTATTGNGSQGTRPAARGGATATASNGNGNGNGNGTPATEPWLVRVKPGYVLGPYGDEITIDCPRDVPLRGDRVTSCAGGAVDELTDSWCSEVYVKDRTGDPLYVAVRYVECQVRPVRAQPAGCGCDDVPCEYSRFRDGYEIGILDHCPASHTRDEPDADSTVRRDNPACPDCPDSPWVVLAKLTLDSEGTITRIDNCSCRRIVPSDRDRWVRCEGTDRDYPPREERKEQPEPRAEEARAPAQLTEPEEAAAEAKPAPRRPSRRRRTEEGT